MHRSLFFLPGFFLSAVFFAATPGGVGQQRSDTKPVNDFVSSRCWSYGIEGGTSLAADQFGIYSASREARVEAISFNGKKLWSSELGGELTSNLVVADTGIFVASSTGVAEGDRSPPSSLKFLKKETGITSFTFKLPAAARHFLYTDPAGLIVVSSNGVIQSIDATVGTLRWKREITAEFDGEPYFNSTKLVVASKDSKLFVISLASGEIETMRKMSVAPVAMSETPFGDLLIGDSRGNLSLYPRGSERAYWRFKSGGSVTNLGFAAGNILAASHDNFVYMLFPRNGSLSWKRRFAGRITHVGILQNGLGLITSLDEHGASFIDLSSGKVVGQMVFESDEVAATDPIIANGSVLVLTNQRVIDYALGKCPEP